jgi:hypothetical protein
MKAYLKENKSSTFGNKFEFTVSANQVSDANFSWEEENEEFRYQHELYDVVSIEKNNDKLVIMCLKDNDENQLENQLKEIHRINNTGSSKTPQNIFKFFSVFYLEKQPKLYFSEKLKKQAIPYFQSNISFSFFDIELPPPRC